MSAAAPPAPGPQRGRRRWLGAATAVLGAAGGYAAWRLAAPPPDPALQELWAQRFERPLPEGAPPLEMAGLRGLPLVLNFWATWCAPCVREMPELDRFAQAHRGQGWRVVGLAIDRPVPVREFLQRLPVGFDIGMAGFAGSALARSLGNTAGGLPFTVVIGRGGEVRARKAGETNLAELRRMAGL